MDKLRGTVIQSVQNASNLPEDLVKNIHHIEKIETHCFNSSDIGFIDWQIDKSYMDLKPRWPKWTERLKIRRTNLAPHCNKTLTRGHLITGKYKYTIEYDSENDTIVHWEEYLLNSDIYESCFHEKAVEKGFELISSDSLREKKFRFAMAVVFKCRSDVGAISLISIPDLIIRPDISLEEFLVENGFLTKEQVEKISKELAEDGIFPPG